MKSNLFRMFGFRAVHDDAADKAAADAAKAATDKAAADKAAADAAAGNGGGGGGGGGDDAFARLKFSPEQQEFVNRKLADERRIAQQQNTKTIDELKKLQVAAGTTEQQKKELQDRINELNRQFLSKEEIQRQEQERQQKEHQAQLQTTKTEAEHWKKMFHETTITRSLQDGAIEFEAYNPNQIIDLLQAKTKLVEEKDAEGNATGRLIPRVTLQDSDTEGKPLTLDLTIKEALQKMRNTPDRFGNLFKSTLAGGLGQGGNANGGSKNRKVDPSKMTPGEWAEFRKKNPSFAGM